ncbi:epoxide hydrolase family protein [Kribbella deserti]|uniref:Epoxide hydrolase family protein n=1 Tax=Kribbella deserti TaxID=1926257 RepID=A0ABV6QQ65_9ACTN
MKNNTEIHPFRIDIAQEQLDDLRRRLEIARYPSEPAGIGWSRGVPVEYLRELVGYWKDSYDWRKHEAALNEFPQYTTEIDGQNVHFIHVRSPEPTAVPIILTHGWPGSIVEFERLIGPLSNPRAHGGDPAQAFHVVVPSVPGFGFSGPTADTGWSAGRIASAWKELMARLGYDRYVAQGGDIGVGITRELALRDGEHVLAIHVNGGFDYPIVDENELAGLTPSERARVDRMNAFMADQAGYIAIQSTRPQTLAYGLVDSPVGQLAWIVEKFKEWTDPANELPHEAVDRDQLLTNVMIYWLTGTAASAAAIYYETAHAEGGAWGQPEALETPAGVALFSTEDVALRSVDERTNNIKRWTEYERGGHFAALEVPDLMLNEIRTFFADYR